MTASNSHISRYFKKKNRFIYLSDFILMIIFFIPVSKMPLPSRRRSSRINRSIPLGQERNILRGHALFVRFLERRELGSCVHYFPEDMTLGTLRNFSPQMLKQCYGIPDPEVDRLSRFIEESLMEEHSDMEVRVLDG